MVLEDVSDPGPARAGNVIVRPEAVGICGSDFHLFSGDVGALSGSRHFYPRIQGHEVSAIVEDPGDAATVRKDDRVAIWPLLPCGTCYPCRLGRPNVCPRFRLAGVHLDGGLQQRIEVQTTVLPQAVDLLSPAGRVVVVGMSSDTVPLRPGAFPEKEIDVAGSSCATAEDFRAAINLVRANRASLAALFSHHFPLTRAVEAFEFAMSQPPDAIKVLVTVD
jgi:threonine dehydrogenase-like Zn-dependent dehydrogenase